MARAKKTKRSLLILLAILLVVGAGVAALELTDTTHLFHSAKTGDAAINYEPATDAEKSDSEQHKQAPPTDTPTDSQTSNNGSSLKTVTPGITTFKQEGRGLTVNGLVNGVVEEGGTCTLTVKQGSKTYTTIHPGEANVTNTTCGAMTIAGPLSPGTWQATLSYLSSTSKGTSGAESIPVN